MKSLESLLEFGSPSSRGRISVENWREVEQPFQPLPTDYKALVSSFGAGSFGGLVLFNPHLVGRLGMPSGHLSAKRFLQDQHNKSTQIGNNEQALVLGEAEGRRMLIHERGNWYFWDYEIQEADILGNDLIEFLFNAFTSLNVDTPLTDIARSIWLGDDGARDPFFLPYSPEPTLG